jgi:hypothetical protein
MADGKQVAIAAAIALAASGAAYGVGRLQTSGKIDAADARASAAASASASALVASRASAEVERGKVARLEARRRLHLATIALEDRNFGIAQEHVGVARTFLVAAKGGDGDVQKLATDLDAFKVVATEDVGEQRKALLAFCKRLDDAMPPPKAP